jgi:uncharacterized protein YjbI with pentapeptide repeats
MTMSSTANNFDIKHRATGAVMFSCSVVLSLSAGVRLGAAVQLAVGARADLRGAYLRGADLTGAYLRGADLRGTDLRGTDLTGADLRGTDLRGTDLTGADLTGADLTGTYLTGAYLTGADLTGTYLTGADLTGADLTGTQSLLDCGSPYSWRVVVVDHADGIRIAAGCRWLTFKQATAHWKARGTARAQMLPLLAYIKAAAKLNKWKL